MRELAARIDSAKAFVAHLGVGADQLQEIDDKLDYVVEAAHRMGRFDWRNLVVGTVVGIAIQAAFAPDQALALLRLILEPIKRIAGG